MCVGGVWAGGGGCGGCGGAPLAGIVDFVGGDYRLFWGGAGARRAGASRVRPPVPTSLGRLRPPERLHSGGGGGRMVGSVRVGRAPCREEHLWNGMRWTRYWL
jgi:hypothetical protein